MNPVAVSLVVLSAVLHALRNFYQKKANDKQIFTFLYGFFSLLFLLPLFIYNLDKDFSFTRVHVILLTGIIHTMYHFFLTKSYEKGELSHVYPIVRSAPALVLLVSIFFLNENVSLLGIVGILTVVFGVYLINLNKLADFFEPLKGLFTEKPTQFAFLTMLCVAGYSIVDSYGVDHYDPAVFLFLFVLMQYLFFMLYVFKYKSKKTIKKEWKLNKKSIVLCGFIGIFGYYLILKAFQIEKLSYVVGLRQLSIIFAVLMGGHILKEKNKLLRFIAAMLIFTGAFMITIAN